MQEISAVCDHVFIISKGNLVASDSMEHLESRMSGAQQLEVTVSGARSDVEQMKEIPGVKSCEITREISEEVMESDNDETPGTDTEQIPLQSEESEQHVETQHGEYHLSILAKENQDIREAVFRYCVAHELVLLELKVNTKTLEDVFLELTGSEEVHKA